MLILIFSNLKLQKFNVYNFLRIENPLSHSQLLDTIQSLYSYIFDMQGNYLIQFYILCLDVYNNHHFSLLFNN
jgi:hypothetical protein